MFGWLKTRDEARREDSGDGELLRHGVKHCESWDGQAGNTHASDCVSRDCFLASFLLVCQPYYPTLKQILIAFSGNL